MEICQSKTVDDEDVQSNELVQDGDGRRDTRMKRGEWEDMKRVEVQIYVVPYLEKR
jgi:hypothetical protein